MYPQNPQINPDPSGSDTAKLEIRRRQIKTARQFLKGKSEFTTDELNVILLEAGLPEARDEEVDEIINGREQSQKPEEMEWEALIMTAITEVVERSGYRTLGDLLGGWNVTDEELLATI